MSIYIYIISIITQVIYFLTTITVHSHYYSRSKRLSLSTAVNGCKRLSTALNGCKRLSTALNGSQRLSTALNGCKRLSTALNGCQRL